MLSDVCRSRTARERDFYIASSLAPSGELSEHLVDGLSGVDLQIRKLAMKFHRTWRHPNCLVMKWYETQTETLFKSIQHWRKSEPPFYHEFLIIQLEDGSTCRVERMGEGPRADAIRRTGCSAFDIIQWFPCTKGDTFADRATLSHPIAPGHHCTENSPTAHAELIVQLDFPCTFDLLDVLAICHTVQHGFAKSSVYTLQRYNCYFLCCTVLVVLTRRLEAWENLITHESLSAAVDETLDDLRNVSLVPMAEQDPVDYFALGICSLVCAGKPESAEFALEEIEDNLRDITCDKVSDALGDILWQDRLDHVVMADDLLDELMDPGFDSDSSAEHSDGGEDDWNNWDDCGSESDSEDDMEEKLSALVGKINQKRFPDVNGDLASIRAAISREVLAACSSMMEDTIDPLLDVLQLQYMEYQPPLHVRLVAFMLGCIVGSILFQPIAIWFAGWYFKKGMNDMRSALNSTLDKFSVTVPQLALAAPSRIRFGVTKAIICSVLDGSNVSETLRFSIIHQTKEVWLSVVDHIAERLQKMLVDHLQQSSEELQTSVGLAWINTCVPVTLRKGCVARSVTRRFVESCNRYLQKRESATLVTRLADDTQKQVTVTQFHDDIQQRIHNHALRVDSFRLAAAPLVSNDIKESMSEIWKLLPDKHKKTKAMPKVEQRSERH